MGISLRVARREIYTHHYLAVEAREHLNWIECENGKNLIEPVAATRVCMLSIHYPMQGPKLQPKNRQSCVS